MKIALFSDTYAPDINGVATSTKILRNELVRLGHEVLVVTTELPSGSTYIDDPVENILRVPGMEISMLYGYRASHLFSFKGMREIKQQGIQVIHCQTEFGIGIFSRIVGEALNIPVVYTYHTMWSDYSHYLSLIKSQSVDGLIKKMIHRFSRVYGNQCTELIVPSNKTKKALQTYGLKKEMNVIPTGLELDRFDPKNKNKELVETLKQEYEIKDEFIITFLGRIAKEKSIDIILEATKELKKTTQNFKVLIVGGGPSLDYLQQLAIDLQIDDVVVFTGPKTHELVPAHYHISNVFVSASLSETQGLTFIEAMASGIPALARHDENLETVIQDGRNGYFFESADDLVTKLQSLMNTDLTTINQNAYHDAMSYSSVNFATNVLEVYKKAISQNHYVYEIERISFTKKDKVEIVCRSDDHDVTIEVSKDCIERFGIEAGAIIDRECFDLLKAQELVHEGYKEALKYLTIKDYTKSQMRKRLQAIGQYEDPQLDEIIYLLEQKNLINDIDYASLYIERSFNKCIGINKAIQDLVSRGISAHDIDQCIIGLEDQEYHAAIELIKKIIQKTTTVSYKMTLRRIRNKLYTNGFTTDTMERALSDYDFVFDHQQEKDVLSKEYEKTLMKYRRKVSNKELEPKIIDVLLKKGFNYNDIRDYINEQGES